MQIKLNKRIIVFMFIILFVLNLIFSTVVKARDNYAYIVVSNYYFNTAANYVTNKLPFWFRQLGYNVTTHSDPSKTEFWESLYADVQYLDGHGDWDKFFTKNSGIIVGEGKDVINSTTKEKRHYFGTNDVHWKADTILVVYAACLTSKDNNHNGLAYQTCQKGADNVIGWKNEIWSDDSCYWRNNFLQALAVGEGVYDAAKFANSKSYPGDEKNDGKSIKNWTQWSCSDSNMKIGNYRTNSKSIESNAKKSQLTSNIEDERNILRNSMKIIEFKNIEDIINIIKEYDTSFNEENYVISKSEGQEMINIINGEKAQETVIDLHLKIGEFYTNAGYVITICDGKVEAIYDNTLPLKNRKVQISDENFIVNSTIKNNSNVYKEMSKKEIRQRSELTGVSNYDIIEQKQTYYYDVETGKKYVRIRSIIEDKDERTKDNMTSLFEI